VEIFAAQGAPPLSTTNGKNLQSEIFLLFLWNTFGVVKLAYRKNFFKFILSCQQFDNCSHCLPPVSLIPVVHLDLQISPQIFEKIQNGPNGILWGWGETES
jgi:hypothetical protein